MIKIGKSVIDGVKVRGDSENGFFITCKKCNEEFKSFDVSDNALDKCPKCSGFYVGCITVVNSGSNEGILINGELDDK